MHAFTAFLLTLIRMSLALLLLFLLPRFLLWQGQLVTLSVDLTNSYSLSAIFFGENGLILRKDSFHSRRSSTSILLTEGKMVFLLLRRFVE